MAVVVCSVVRAGEEKETGLDLPQKETVAALRHEQPHLSDLAKDLKAGRDNDSIENFKRLWFLVSNYMVGI